MALAPIQTNELLLNQGTSTPVLSANCRIGSCVVLCIATHGSNLDLVSFISSSMGSFVQVNASNVVADTEIWICEQTTAAGMNVTTGGGGTNMICFAVEYPPVLSYASIAPLSAGSTHPQSAPSLLGGQAAVIFARTNLSSPTAGPTTPWTDVDTAPVNWANFVDAAYMTASTSTTFIATWTLPTSTTWQTQGVALTPRPSGGMFAFFARH